LDTTEAISSFDPQRFASKPANDAARNQHTFFWTDKLWLKKAAD
jgi:hypothetical protein